LKVKVRQEMSCVKLVASDRMELFSLAKTQSIGVVWTVHFYSDPLRCVAS
jgi:hypothetical protein